MLRRCIIILIFVFIVSYIKYENSTIQKMLNKHDVKSYKNSGARERRLDVSNNVVVASLITTAPGRSLGAYVYLLHIFIKSLRVTGYGGDIVVLVTNDVRDVYVQKIRAEGAIIIVVDKLGVKREGIYQNMISKYHLWNLNYSMVIYYDADHVFLGNPVPCITGHCTAELCATIDTGTPMRKEEDMDIEYGEYFNAGFLVIRPSKSRYDYLMSNTNLAEGKTFVEQDALNTIFKGKWQKLSKEYSIQCIGGCPRVVPGGTMAIHGKLQEIEQYIPPSVKNLTESSDKSLGDRGDPPIDAVTCPQQQTATEREKEKEKKKKKKKRKKEKKKERKRERETQPDRERDRVKERVKKKDKGKSVKRILLHQISNSSFEPFIYN